MRILVYTPAGKASEYTDFIDGLREEGHTVLIRNSHYATTADRRAQVVYSDEEQVEALYNDTETDVKSLPGQSAEGAGNVSFASDAAEKLAQEAGLTATDFEGVDASAKTGYGKADVEKVISAQEEDD